MKTLLLIMVVISSIAYAQDVAFFKQLVAIPSGAGKNQNGYTYLKTATMMDLFGTPCSLTPNCIAVTNADLKDRIKRKAVTKFTLSGSDIALDALGRALIKLKAGNPDLYAALGNSGMLCCRAIRGSSTSFSNHAWGFAADFNIGGTIDPRGDAKTQRGMALLWPYMREQGFYWAAGYSGASEDAMHFEIANELMLNYAKAGDWGTCTNTAGTAGRCLDVGECSTTTVTGRCPGPANIKCCVGAPAKKFTCLKSATTLRATACNTAAQLLPIPAGEQLETIGTAETTACGNTWRKVRARNAFTGFVPSSTFGTCIAGRDDIYIDPNYNQTLDFPDVTDGTDVFPDDHEIGNEDEFEITESHAQLISFLSVVLVIVLAL